MPAGGVGSLLLLLAALAAARAAILTPPYFNLAEGRRISATATCGEDFEGPELYCKLVGANADRDVNINVIQGQVCDYCDPTRLDQMHPPQFAVDGAETWWQSPPLSRGMKYNEVNLTIDLGQEFHVAYVFIRMANSPRPGVWVLERSLDNGKTYQPWQYFADTLSDCEAFFGPESIHPITRDDSVVCETQYSKVVPLEGGEIVVSLLNNRPSANDFFNSTVLQEWTRATNIRLRFLRTKTLLGHLMSVARQDPTVTRRYFYSIKDISIGGRCVCNGHADTCDITDPEDPYKLLCRCQHNTCGANCDKCCPGFEQKAWRLSKSYKPFICEPCNCFNHAEECVYDPEVDNQQLSLDVHGNYDGGGVCQNCRDNTEGVNCNRCKPGYYRPYGKQWNETDVCYPCDCNNFYSTGNCAEGNGQCECRKEFTPPLCDSCSFGYFDYPECKACECHLNGTEGFHCEASDGQCPCKPNYAGHFCDQCAPGFYNFPECLSCDCNLEGAMSESCNFETGQCSCRSNFGGRTCDQCEDGYFGYPQCSYCSCDVRGTLPGVCDKETGQCLCKEGYWGDRCDQCIPEYHGYPTCKPCNCSTVGSASTVCDVSGVCRCLENFAGRTCDQCKSGYYHYPECLNCDCDSHGSIGVSCDSEGKCQCRPHFDGNRCDQCKEGFYNFPICEECNCDPAGVLETFAGCGSLPAGELCQCKPRVLGRICDKCRPLYWNLQAANPEGCEDCDCHLPGVMGGLGVCDTKSGQCMCKPSVTARRCDECSDGTYNLRKENLYGCTDCGCDIGGSINKICDKETGQCICRPRIDGRTCREPLKVHYFPTLYQYQYEAEDGHTSASTPVRYAFDESVFPGYSWKGYAVFSLLQNEIIQDIFIEKPSLYRMVLRYVNPSQDTILGTITISPDNPGDIEQTFQVQFKPTRIPSFVTVSGPTGTIPSPLVMNPGRWSVAIKNEKNLFLDYFVFIPAAFYEAAILVEKVDTPCEVGNKDFCRHFHYPNLTRFDMVRGDGGFLSDGDSRESIREHFTNHQQLSELKQSSIPLINDKQPKIHLGLKITKPGPHILLVNYLTPANDSNTATLHVETSSQNDRDKGKVTLYACPYTDLCRQAVIDKRGRVAVFNFDTHYISLVLKGEEGSNVAVESIVAIPADEWSLDYQLPKSACVRKDGKCIQGLFPTPPDSKKVEFEHGNEDLLAKTLPPLYDNSTKLVYLDESNSMVDITGKVPYPGQYVFVIHYYQPDHPEFNTEVLVHNGQVYEAKLPVQHCPSISGCRSIVKQSDGNTHFYLTENFVFTLKEPNSKGLWVDYALVIPAEQFAETVLQEEPVDHTGTFINKCGQNHFFIDTETEGFCRDAVFSLTSDYNNGAKPCHCDFDGSLTIECEMFGGQCLCKPNVIGRRCEACKTGFFGFPDCKPCDCPSTALCETYTGECICPPRVTGEKCNTCEALTYGFDQIIGCEECNCEPLGVERGNLQCDLFNGSCTCRQNVVGRTCDKCRAGHWAYPNCLICDCDLRGTTHDICNQRTAECYCKSNVYGQACDLCKDGTFNLQERNFDGCTKCFCSGKTSRCSSSSLYRAQVSKMEDWTLAAVNSEPAVNIETLNTLPEQLRAGVGADLTSEEAVDKIVYFSAPAEYLGNKLTAYGGFLNYSIYYTTGLFGSAIGAPDVIMMSSDLHLLHYSLEQPAAAILFQGSLELVESNFQLPTGSTASRDQVMQVLHNLQGLLIRATYWEGSVTARLQEVNLDVAVEGYNPNSTRALEVEQCQCPPNYQGLSCEECAPGYYRSQTGPFGGFCAPCQCNGHADTCDQVTGICHDCKHNTTGDHCELCEVGHHGDATVGTPKDCLICACPLPIRSNNFAKACEVSADGNRISCDCNQGYYGARCQSCAAGYFGKPQEPGNYCRPCECSGNIDPENPGSCDSVTGECLQCLNNTFGRACNLCAPGFYGDAIQLKNCQSCECDRCGMKQCDSYSGQCQCHNNVVGERCDRCDIDHYGFSSCQGCLSCDCQLASDSSQCDGTTGQCLCKPGVTGRMCDRCSGGYWNYSADGCISCGCNTEYSVGLGCNPNTGQCECLPGVIGEKCDHCPYRWVLIEDEGCFECDSCTHDLLDVTDSLQARIDPVVIEFQTVASTYFTTQRLVYINNTVVDLIPKVNLLDPLRVDLGPITQELESLEQDSKNLNRRAEYAVENGEQSAPDGDKVRVDALEVEELIQGTVGRARDIVGEVSSLAFSLEGGAGPQVDTALNEAQHILQEIQQRDFTPWLNKALEESDNADQLLAKMKDFTIPVYNQSEAFKELRERIEEYDHKLEDLRNHSINSIEKAEITDAFNNQNKNAKVMNKVETVKNLKEEANETAEEAKELLKNASALLEEAQEGYSRLIGEHDIGQDARNQLNESVVEMEFQLQQMPQYVRAAQLHTQNLTDRAAKLDGLFEVSRVSSEHAVGAANAYKNIVDAIEEALQAAKDAGSAAENATDLSEGLGDRAGESEARSSTLLQEARSTLDKAQRHLEPQLRAAMANVAQVKEMNRQSDEGDSAINRGLKKIPMKSLEPTARKAAEDSEDADEVAQDALGRIENIVEQLPEQVKEAKQLPKNVDDTKKAISQAYSQMDRVNSVVPDLNRLIDQVENRQSDLQNVGTLVKDQLEALKQKVAMARDLVNRIKVGVTFYRNTTLELKNPEGLPLLGTSTRASVYFKTGKPNGFLFYLGNEIGTSRKLRRALTDDFMALEIENGYPVLTIDLGSGPQRVISEKRVDDDTWHQAIVERSGKNVKLIIRSEEGEGREDNVVKEQVLTGTFSIFNLDQEQSKLFVGGYPTTFNIQPAIKYSSFEGQMEDLVVGNVPVSLWNFVDAANNQHGSVDRDKLVNLQPSTGYRFDGNGYAIIDGKSYRMKTRSDVQFKFKTFVKDGLLFLAGKGKSFLSVELRDGKVLYQYQLGHGLTPMMSSGTYNDGKWHSLEAARQGKQGLLRVDGEEVSKESAPGTATTLQVSENLYFGGYPGKHAYRDVTNINLDGCIDQVQIGGTPVDLSQNVQAFGVTPGCPAQVASLVAFDDRNPGYVRWPNASAPNFLQLNFRFKTSESRGLIFYAANRDQSSTMSLSLVNGGLVMRSQREELATSPSIQYNDNEWHVVTATHSEQALQLDIDDFDSLRTDASPPMLHITYGNMFFGGVPSNYQISSGTTASVTPFVGCIGDATVNGVFINFANATDRVGAILGKCLGAEQQPPVLRPVAPTIPEEDGDEDQGPAKFPPPVTTTIQSIPETEKVDEINVVTAAPTLPTPAPTPVGDCALPLHPASDPDVTPEDGFRFGTVSTSRMEYTSVPGRIKNKYDFAIDFKTLSDEGVLFYVAGEKHIDFIALFMKDGQIHYSFNCGSGPAYLVSPKQYNDGQWHTVVFSRQNTNGKLTIDEEMVAEGNSKGNTKTLNVIAPFFFGGISPQISEQAKPNLKGLNGTFEGCLRNFLMGGRPVLDPVNSVGVVPCSDKVEPGVFFAAEGGYIKAYNKFTVGLEISIKMEIKPRNVSGILLSVHGRRDFLILQMVDGVIMFSVDNGHGPISASFNHSSRNYFCDGQWHNIQAVKTKNVVTLSVDTVSVEPGIGIPGSSSTETRHPLYIGGHPNRYGRIRGLQTRQQFVGCMRNVMINNNLEKLSSSQAFGNVTASVCPTI